MKPILTLEDLLQQAGQFADMQSRHYDSALYGVSDGKAIGTYFEHRFRQYLQEHFDYEIGNSAKGIDFPSLDVDMKVTSVRQPQSSCPFKSARQKIYGLGYSLLVFVYDKGDDPATQTGLLKVLHVIFVENSCTGDYQTTSGILRILDNNGNKDDLLAFMQERLLPCDEIEASKIADELLLRPPSSGYLTISNALQWRLQYSRAIEQAGVVAGVSRIH